MEKSRKIGQVVLIGRKMINSIDSVKGLFPVPFIPYVAFYEFSPGVYIAGDTLWMNRFLKVIEYPDVKACPEAGYLLCGSR